MFEREWLVFILHSTWNISIRQGLDAEKQDLNRAEPLQVPSSRRKWPPEIRAWPCRGGDVTFLIIAMARIKNAQEME